MFLSKFSDFIREQYNDAFNGGIKESVNEALSPEKVNFFGVEVDPSIYTALLLLVVLTLFAVIIRIFIIPKFKIIPTKFQMILESLVDFFNQASLKSSHKSSGIVGPFAFLCSIYIAVGTLVELLGFRPVFASINGCIAMGVLAFVTINIVAFREKKLKRFNRYFPNILNVVTDLAVPVSMSLRIFGTVISGFIIMELLYTNIYTSIITPALVALITTIVHAFLQAYIYSTLTNIFVEEAVE